MPTRLQNREEKGPTQVRGRGRKPGTAWEIDFTEVKPGKFGYRYLLVMVNTFSGWVEAFPTKKETGIVAAKKIPEEIVPRYGVPERAWSTREHNGPAFLGKFSQGLAQAVGADWKLHSAYNPQSPGQVERMNQTILTKLALETGGDWVTLLPFALFRARNTPYKLGLTPFEIMYGYPLPVFPQQREIHPAIEHPAELAEAIQALQRVQRQIWPALHPVFEGQGRDIGPHPFQPGDWVWVRRHNSKTLEPRWKAPFQIILVI